MPRWMVYTGSGSFTVPSDYSGTSARIIVIGAGGGGARGNTGNNVGGGGGGGGGVAYGSFSVTAGQTIYYQAGTGGAGASSNNTNGTAGQASWVNVSSNAAPTSGTQGVLANGGDGGSAGGGSASGGTGVYGVGTYTGGTGAPGGYQRSAGGGGGAAAFLTNDLSGANGKSGYAGTNVGGGGGGMQGNASFGTGGMGYTDFGGSGGAGGNGGTNTSTSGATAGGGFNANSHAQTYYDSNLWYGGGGGGGGGGANTNTTSGSGGGGANGGYGGGGGGGGNGATTTGNGGSGGGGLVIFAYVPSSMYWVGGTGTWSQASGFWWSSSSGGSGQYGIPLALDYALGGALSNVNFLSTSFPGTSGITITVGQGAGCNSLTFGALPYNLTFNSTNPVGYTLSIYGNVTLQSTNLTWGFLSAVSLNETAGATKTIDTAGLTVNNAWSLTGVSGSIWQLANNFTNTSTLELVSGGFNALTYNVDILSFASSNTNTRTLYPGSGTWTLRGTGTIWNCATVTNLSVSPNSATINVTSTTPLDRTFDGGNTGTMSYTDWNGLSITHSGTNSLIIVGQNKFNTITVGASRSIKFESGQTNRATTFAFAGTSPAARVTIASTSSGSAASLYKELPTATTANTVNVQNCSIKDIVAANSSVSYLAYTLNGNLDNGGNTGWVFNPPNFLPLLD